MAIRTIVYRLARRKPVGFPLVVGCGLRQGAVDGLPRNSYPAPTITTPLPHAPSLGDTMSLLASSAFPRRQVCGGAPLLASVYGVVR